MWRRKKAPEPSIPSLDSRPADPVLTDPTGESAQQAVIGKDLVFKGEVSGTQDLTIHGRLEGTLSLSGYTVTVGREGRVQGDVVARVIRIEGRVKGNLQGEELVFLGPSAVVHGDITTVRVSMQEGCEYRGHVQVAVEELPASEPSEPLIVSPVPRVEDPGELPPGRQGFGREPGIRRSGG